MVKAAWEVISIIFTHLGLDIELDSISLASAWLEQSALFLTLLCSMLPQPCYQNSISSRGSAGTIDPGKKKGILRKLERWSWDMQVPSLTHSQDQDELWVKGSGWWPCTHSWECKAQAMHSSSRVSTAHLYVQETEGVSSTHWVLSYVVLAVVLNKSLGSCPSNPLSL